MTIAIICVILAGFLPIVAAGIAKFGPLEQNAPMTLGALGLGYEIKPGWSVYGYTGMVNYGQKGLAPLSMPSHSSFSGVDSRVATNGRWFGVGSVYAF